LNAIIEGCGRAALALAGLALVGALVMVLVAEARWIVRKVSELLEDPPPDPSELDAYRADELPPGVLARRRIDGWPRLGARRW
jgi:hypothetical protein